MSTNALIAYKNEHGKYNVNSVHYDGYIEGGVGETLFTYWKHLSDVKQIIGGKELKCLRSNKFECEYFNDRAMRKRKNLDFDTLCNEAGNYDYTYVFKPIIDGESESKGKWYLLPEYKDLEEFFKP